MDQLLRYSLFFMIISVLGGCNSKHLRLTKNTPDEFESTQQPPLEVPEVATLQDPALGAPRPQYRNAADRVKTILKPSTTEASEKKTSPTPLDTHQSEQRLLHQIGTKRKTSNIRRTIDTETPDGKPTFGQKLKQTLTFWRDPPRPGRVIDPEAEQVRLEQQGVITPRSSSSANEVPLSTPSAP